jgi:RNA polymerase sigma factor (sigma-70 family)
MGKITERLTSHYHKAIKYATTCCKDEELAVELVQDAYLSLTVAENNGSIKEHNNQYGVFTAVKYAWYSYLRNINTVGRSKESKEKWLFENHTSDKKITTVKEGEEKNSFKMRRFPMAYIMPKEELSDEYEVALSKLSANEKKAIQLHMDGYNGREISEHLPVGLRAGQQTLLRAKEKLAKELGYIDKPIKANNSSKIIKAYRGEQEIVMAGNKEMIKHGFTPQAVNLVLKGKRNHHKGWKFKYDI